MASHGDRGIARETKLQKRKRQRILVCQLVGELVAHAQSKQDAVEIAELVLAGLDWAYGDGDGEEDAVQPLARLRLLP